MKGKGLPLLFCLALMGGCMVQIPPASVGVKFDGSSGISEKLLTPQVVYRGWNQRIIVYPTSIRNATYVRNAKEGERAVDDSIVASTSEGGQLPMDITVAWHVDAGNVDKMFASFGTEDLDFIQRTFIRYYTSYCLNCVTGKKSIFDVTSKDRAGIGGEVKQALRPIMDEYGITVDEVYVGEVYPNEDVLAKVNERLNKFNELGVAKNRLEQAKIDKQTILTNANKQAQMNEMLSQQGDSILQLKRIENKRAAIEKWDGQPPAVGDNSIPFTTVRLK
ncbi:MAG: hypothetical protein JSS72_10845 [Armatimonadetes bacterium]|nr:hypothetical protein [Armatimonadota bacterium]